MVVIYLTVRSLKTRNYQVLLLAASFLVELIIQFIEPLEQKYILRGFLDYDYILFILLFTKYAYHQKQKSHFSVMFMITMALRVVEGILVVVFQFDIPNTYALVGFNLAIYWVYLACGGLMTWIAYGWLVHSALITFMKSKNVQSVPAWFKFRNKWVAIGFSVFLVLPVLWFSLPTDGSGYGELIPNQNGMLPLPAILGIAIAIPLFASLIFNAIAWITPQFIINRFNSVSKGARDAQKRELADIVSSEKALDITASEKILNQRGIIDLVSYLGDFLANIIDKPPNAAKGLIFFSIQSQLGEDAVHVMKLKQIMEVINGALKDRLEIMQGKSADEIVKQLNKKIIDEQSILMMLAI
ncbi:MAG TPA: hypothetical protein VKM55_30530 [Candidatus Lokiarchaeia archaeon]|nr:hypothetical protein [Candidatus Lokiarchaeia archaeon]